MNEIIKKINIKEGPKIINTENKQFKIFAFDAFNMTSVVGVFRSGGDTLFALFMDVGFMWLLALPLGWLAVLVWHLPFWAVYLCILSEPVCKAIVGIIHLSKDKWLRNL